MPSYSLLLNDRPISLAPYSHGSPEAAARFGRTFPEGALRPLMSVQTSKTGSEPINNPAGLYRDAVMAAERVALDALAVYDSGVEVTILKHLAGDVTRTEGYATAHLSRNPGGAGRAIVESHRCRARAVPLAAILQQEDSGKRSYSFVCRVAQQVAEFVANGVEQDRAVRLVAAQRGASPSRVQELVYHGIAAASFSADRARRNEAPVVAIAR